MVLYSMWERSVHYADGWYIYSDGRGHASVISKQRARELELDYNCYQASQDINRGGAPFESAYNGRGIICTQGSDGRMHFEMASYEADHVAGSMPPVEFKGALTIPREIDAFTIDMVYDGAFAGCTELETIVLPDTVTSIGEKAFSGCIRLSSVVLPRGLGRIGEKAFEGTQVLPEPDPAEPVGILEYILVKADPSIRGEYAVPEHVTVIADHAFSGCAGLTGITIHDGVTGIGEYAFSDCTSLAAIRMPKRISSLGWYCFRGCSSLESVDIPYGVKHMLFFPGCTKLARVTIPLSVESIDYRCFEGTALMNAFLAGDQDMLVVDRWLINYRVNSQGTLTMDDDIIGIADQDWSKHNTNDYRSLKSVYISKGLKYMGSNAFERTGITRIALPEGLRRLGWSCFRGTPLRSITIPGTVETMEQWSLMDCEDLETVVFLGNTKVDQFAITGRKDRGAVNIVAGRNTSAHEYVQKNVGRRLSFSELKRKGLMPAENKSTPVPTAADYSIGSRIREVIRKLLGRP